MRIEYPCGALRATACPRATAPHASANTRQRIRRLYHARPPQNNKRTRGLDLGQSADIVDCLAASCSQRDHMCSMHTQVTRASPSPSTLLRSYRWRWRPFPLPLDRKHIPGSFSTNRIISLKTSRQSSTTARELLCNCADLQSVVAIYAKQ